MIKILTSKNSITENLWQEMKKSKNKKILIVPELFSHKYEIELLKNLGNSSNSQVLSFSRIVHRIFEETGGLSKIYLSDAGKTISVSKAIKDASAALQIYKNTKNIDEIIKVIDDFKKNNIQAQDVIHSANMADGILKRKLLDVGYIYMHYENTIKENNQDKLDAFKTAIDKIKDAKLFLDTEIYIDSFTGFTKLEIEMLLQIIKKANNTTIAIISGEEEIFLQQQKTIQHIKTLHIQTEIINIDNTKCREDSKQNSKQESSINPMVFLGEKSENINLHISENVYGECHFVLANILRLVRDENYNFSDFTVLARDFSEYNEIFKILADYYDVPIYLSKKTDVLSKSLFSMLFAAMDIAINNFRQDDFIKYIKSGLINIDESDILENYIMSVNVYGKKLCQDFIEDETLLNDESLDNINEIRKKVAEPLQDFRQEFLSAKNVQDFAKSLYNFAENINLSQKILNITGKISNKQSSDEYLALWDVFIDSLEQFFTVQYNDLSAKEFKNLFKKVLENCDVATIPKIKNSVNAGDIDRAVIINSKTTFILGANDGLLPRNQNNNGIFKKSDEEELIALGIEFNSDDNVLRCMEDFYIYKAILMTSEKLFISYNKNTYDGENLYPSYIINNILQSNPKITTENIEEYKTYAQKPCFSLACTDGGRYSAAAYRYFKDSEKLAQILSFSNTEKQTLTKERINRLYGLPIKLSASKLETAVNCRFSFFMQYGLLAKKRRKFDMDAIKMGNFVHYILENVMAKKPDDLKQAHKLTKEYIEIYIVDNIGDINNKSEKFRYIFNKLCENTYIIIENIMQECLLSKFSPIDFELEFKDGGDLKSINIADIAVLSGKVDRIDGYIENDKLYIRVLDYKSSKKSFNLYDVYHGMNLQMLIYLFALEKNGLNHYKDKVSENLNQIRPAGALYVQSGRTIIERGKSIDDEFRRTGILVNDENIINAMEKNIAGKARFLPVAMDKEGGLKQSDSLASFERLGKLSKFIDKKLLQIAVEINSGNTLENPFHDGKSYTSCKYCDFKQACHFDERIHSGKYLFKIGSDAFWDKIGDICE